MGETNLGGGRSGVHDGICSATCGVSATYMKSPLNSFTLMLDSNTLPSAPNKRTHTHARTRTRTRTHEHTHTHTHTRTHARTHATCHMPYVRANVICQLCQFTGTIHVTHVQQKRFTPSCNNFITFCTPLFTKPSQVSIQLQSFSGLYLSIRLIVNCDLNLRFSFDRVHHFVQLESQNVVIY